MNKQLKKQKPQPKIKQAAPAPAKKVKITKFRPRIRSRHPSHKPMRTGLPLMPFRSVVRFGSTTEELGVDVECNTVQAVKNSSSKKLMKECFRKAGIRIAEQWLEGDLKKWATDRYPLIAKSHFGSRGNGNHLIKNLDDLNKFLATKKTADYIFEKYYSYSREYRLHVTEEGCFYTCRKMLKGDCPEDKKFQRHDDNCVWILEENPAFDKPVNWNAVVADCVKALKSLGLDIGAFDLKIQSAKNKKTGAMIPNPEWIVIESCSAPSFGEKTTLKYAEEIPKVLTRKFNKQNQK